MYPSGPLARICRQKFTVRSGGRCAGDLGPALRPGPAPADQLGLTPAHHQCQAQQGEQLGHREQLSWGLVTCSANIKKEREARVSDYSLPTAALSVKKELWKALHETLSN